MDKDRELDLLLSYLRTLLSIVSPSDETVLAIVNKLNEGFGLDVRVVVTQADTLDTTGKDLSK